MFLENELLYGVSFPVREEVWDKDFVVSLSKAKVMREGTDVTLVAFSKMVRPRVRCGASCLRRYTGVYLLHWAQQCPPCSHARPPHVVLWCLGPASAHRRASVVQRCAQHRCASVAQQCAQRWHAWRLQAMLCCGFAFSHAGARLLHSSVRLSHGSAFTALSALPAEPVAPVRQPSRRGRQRTHAGGGARTVSVAAHRAVSVAMGPSTGDGTAEHPSSAQPRQWSEWTGVATHAQGTRESYMHVRLT